MDFISFQPVSQYFYIGKNSSIDVLWQFVTPALYKFTQ